MCYRMAFADINWISVLVASLVAFAIGAIWYAPKVFGNRWAKELGLTNEQLKSANMPLIFGTTFVLIVMSAAGLDMIIGPDGWWFKGLMRSTLTSLFFVVPALGTNYLFGRKSVTLFLIDAGYFVLLFATLGIILGAW